jgi:threonine aldolase
MRFAAAQLNAYVEDGRFLRFARRANELAARLEAGLRDLPEVRLVAPVEANALFLDLPPTMIERLEKRGVLFYRRGPRVIRLLCRHDGREEDVEKLLRLLRE